MRAGDAAALAFRAQVERRPNILLIVAEDMGPRVGAFADPLAVFDRQKAVRDGRFKYIRSYAPDEPFFRLLDYRDTMPSMQALWAARGKGVLTPAQQILFAAPCPAEDLYDVRADPFETVNLAAEVRHADDHRRMRCARPLACPDGRSDRAG